MKSYHRIGIAALAVVAVGMWVQGVLASPPQGGQGPRGFAPGRGVEQMAKQLNLSEEQKRVVQTYLEDERSQLQALRNDTSLTREQKAPRMQEITQQTRDKVRSILTVEQQQKVEDAQKRAGELQNDRREFAANQMAKRLDLTEAQKTQVQSYLEEQRTQLQALRQDNSLSREQSFERMRDVQQQTQDQIRATLTPDQQERLDQMRDRMQQRGAGRGRGRGFGGMGGPGRL